MGAFFLCMAVAIVIPFVLTVFFKKTGILAKTEEDAVLDVPLQEPVVEETGLAAGAIVTLTSPLSGEVKDLSTAKDPVFAQGVMGQGVLIGPSEGELVAPINGTVPVLFLTKHAVGLISEDGVEILMHIGMDTVGLDGKGFEELKSLFHTWGEGMSEGMAGLLSSEIITTSRVLLIAL